MKRSDHIEATLAGNLTPRVVEHYKEGVGMVFYAWTPTWEGPARLDFPAAAADLRDKLKGIQGS